MNKYLNKGISVFLKIIILVSFNGLIFLETRHFLGFENAQL